MTPEQIQSALDSFNNGYEGDPDFFEFVHGKTILHALTQALEIAKGDKVVVRKSDIAKAMLCLLTSESIDDTIWLDEKDMIGMTLFEHLEIIGDINIENRCPAEMADQLEAMIAVAEGDE